LSKCGLQMRLKIKDLLPTTVAFLVHERFKRVFWSVSFSLVLPALNTTGESKGALGSKLAC